MSLNVVIVVIENKQNITMLDLKTAVASYPVSLTELPHQMPTLSPGMCRTRISAKKPPNQHCISSIGQVLESTRYI